LDAWNGVNGTDLLGKNISYAGNTHLFKGNISTPLVLRAGAISRYSDISGTRREAYDRLNRMHSSNPFKRLHRSMFDQSMRVIDEYQLAMQNAPAFSSKDAYGNDLFSIPTINELGLSEGVDTSLISQLESVAKMAKVSKERGIKRQIFYVQQGGYDTHAAELQNHPRHLRTLSLAIDKFVRAMKELDMHNDVTTFNLSDFGRSIGDNGGGTDHGWGGNYFVVGGAVESGLYGTPARLVDQGEDDIGSKGRIIPSTSTDQYIATLLNWFGADAALQHHILPNLHNFEKQNLGFLG
jgi:uncharacterized protein (DUF1501 family)